jgi:hypothetical protein
MSGALASPCERSHHTTHLPATLQAKALCRLPLKRTIKPAQLTSCAPSQPAVVRSAQHVSDAGSRGGLPKGHVK